jgi:hypothetical protein
MNSNTQRCGTIIKVNKPDSQHFSSIIFDPLILKPKYLCATDSNVSKALLAQSCKGMRTAAHSDQ